MATKEKDLFYWLPRIIALVGALGLIASASIRFNDAEKKTAMIPAVEWDLVLIKSMLRAISPIRYDSVMNNQVQIYGPRPEDKK